MRPEGSTAQDATRDRRRHARLAQRQARGERGAMPGGDRRQREQQRLVRRAGRGDVLQGHAKQRQRREGAERDARGEPGLAALRLAPIEAEREEERLRDEAAREGRELRRRQLGDAIGGDRASRGEAREPSEVGAGDERPAGAPACEDGSHRIPSVRGPKQARSMRRADRARSMPSGLGRP
jgi:hypothetical protein